MPRHVTAAGRRWGRTQSRVGEETTGGSACLHLTLGLLKKCLLALFNHSSLVHRPVRAQINKSLARGTAAQAAGAGGGSTLLHSPFIHQNDWQRAPAAGRYVPTSHVDAELKRVVGLEMS